MADDHNQRPYRASDTRVAPTAAPASGGGDPLAELARLIGQSDPFGEFGRDGTRRAAPQRAAEPVADWSAEAANPAYAPAPAAARTEMPQAQNYRAPSYGQEPFAGGQQYAAAPELYRTDAEAGGYAAAPEQGDDYPADPYYQNQMHPGGDDDLYEDVAPPRRRMGIIAIAGIFALAVIGTAGAFGYRALFGSSGSNMPPPVIKADTAPSKIVPAASSKDAQSNKAINDRVGGNGEKLVSREEQPVDFKDRPVGMQSAQGGDQQAAPLQPALGSGVVGSEPKKIRTIVIRADQNGASTNMVEAEPVPTQAPAPTASPTPIRTLQIAPSAQPAAPPPAPQAAPQRVASAPPPRAETPAPRQAVARTLPPVAAAPVHRANQVASSAKVASSGNAPLSLNPNDAAPAPAPAPTRAAAPAPMRTAAVAQPTRIEPQAQPASGGGSGRYLVQVSSQRSEAEAQAAFRGMQAKYPTQLGGHAPVIHKVDLGAKGVYYRAMVGPFASSGEAGQLCSSLKSAGGQCIVQRN
jgi:hypothetical protein